MMQLRQLLDRLQTSSSELAAHAKALRPGHDCTVDVPASTDMLLRGGMNVHIPITFDDGVSWFARVRQKNSQSPPKSMVRTVLSSEAATIMALKDAGALVPDVYLPHGGDESHRCSCQWVFGHFVAAMTRPQRQWA
jgi:hypothetical protein